MQIRTLIIMLLVTIALTTNAQEISINEDGSNPDGSAMLDVVSTNKGVLIPRMTQAERNAIVNPATGLLIYQTNMDTGFYFNKGLPGTPNWQLIITDANLGEPVAIQDADGDTRIQVEESVDEDIIRFDNDTRETFTFRRGRLEVLDAGRTVAIGEGAGAADDFSLNDNTLIGFEAGNRLTTGFRNISIGNFSLTQAISSNNSIAIGFEALRNSTGFRNVAIGSNALQGALTTADNVAVGYEAALSNGANRNTAIGTRALSSNTSGSNNVAIGVDAGNANGGSSNIFLGYQAGQNELGSHKLYIENSNSSTPLIYGDFTNDSLKVYGTLSVDSAKDGSGYTFPGADGNIGQVLQTNGSGVVSWGSISGVDNLGNHTATTNINLNGNYLSGDGTAEGIHIDADGDVTIGSDKGFNLFQVRGETGDGDIDISFYSEDAKPELSFGAHGSGSNSGSIISFFKARGDWLSSTPVQDGDNVVKFNTTLKYSTSSIEDNFFSLDVDGTPVGSTVPTSLKFYTVNPIGFYNPLVMLSSGNVGIGLSSPSARLEVDGRAIVDTLEIDGEYSLPADDGTNGQVLQTDGSGNVSWAVSPSPWGTSGSNVFRSSGRVGIGTSSPQSAIEISENVVSSGSGVSHQITLEANRAVNLFGGEGIGILFKPPVSGTATYDGAALEVFRESSNDGQQTTSMAFRISNSSTTLFEAMRINSKGFLGINTPNPNFGLDVDTTASVNELNINDVYTFPSIDGNPNEVLQTDGSGNVSWAAQSSIWNQVGTDINYTSGKVSIGQNTTSSTLYVSESIAPSDTNGAFIDVQNDVGVSGTLSGIRFKNNTIDGNTRYNAAIYHRIASTNDYQLNFAVRENPILASNISVDEVKMTINDEGNVGIGTSAPNAPLQFISDTRNRKIVLWESDDNDHQFYGFGVNAQTLRYQTVDNLSNHVFYAGNGVNASIELMRINGNGNVGIGVNAPDQKLDVDGNIELTGEIHTSSTGNFNMLPIAMANISIIGGISSSSGNVTVNQVSPGIYRVSVSGHTANINSDVVSATPISSSHRNITVSSLSGDYLVYTTDQSGILTNSAFNLVIYSP